jgi:hypothetical protein
VSRIDKYEPLTGGHRAPLAADWLVGNLSKVVPVGLDANGKVVVGLGNTGYVGVVVLTRMRVAGDIVDVMQDGDIVEFNSPGAVAGTNYFADAATSTVVAGTGAQTATAPATAGSKKVGYTVEATRLVVRMGRA